MQGPVIDFFPPFVRNYVEKIFKVYTRSSPLFGKIHAKRYVKHTYIQSINIIFRVVFIIDISDETKYVRKIFALLILVYRAYCYS